MLRWQSVFLSDWILVFLRIENVWLGMDLAWTWDQMLKWKHTWETGYVVFSVLNVAWDCSDFGWSKAS